MTEEKKVEGTLKKLNWFREVVENVPRPTGGSFADRVVDLESAKLVRAAGEVAMDAVQGNTGQGGLERGISAGLEVAGKQIIERKLTGEDPITKKVMDALGDFVGDAVRDRLGGSKGQSDAEKELAAIRHREELEAIVGKINDELIQPLVGQVQALNEKLEKKGTGGEVLTTDAAVEMVMSAQERAKKLLVAQGYSVESVNVSKEDVKKMLDEEEHKFQERIMKEKTDWEEKSGAQVEIETERIKATENILSNVVDRVMDMFLSPLKIKIEEAVDKGAFRAAPPPGV